MSKAFGKVFKNSNNKEYGVIRKSAGTFPDDLQGVKVIAEDECGNYFVDDESHIYFWDHETGERELLAKSMNEFLSGCVSPSEVELRAGQVESVWVDPEFAKRFNIKI